MNENIFIKAELNVDKEPQKIPTFRMEPAYSGGELYLKGWEYPVVIDCNGIKASQNLKIVKKHSGIPLGVTKKVEIDNEIRAYGEFTFYDTEDGKDVRDIINASKDGFKWECSIGTKPIDKAQVDFIPSGSTIRANYRTFHGPCFFVKACELKEISVVVFGADLETNLIIEANRKENDMSIDLKNIQAHAQAIAEETESEIKTETPNAPEQANAAQTTGTIEAERAVEPPPAPTQGGSGTVHNHYYGAEFVPRLQVAGKDEPPKKRGITASGERRRDGADFVDSLEQNHTFTSANRPQEGDIIEAALLMNVGIKAERCEKLGCHQNAINEAMSGDYRNFSIRKFFIKAMRQMDPSFNERNYGEVNESDFKQFCYIAAEQDRTYGNKNNNVPKSIQAAGAFSTISVPGILSNIGHKTLLDGFNNVPSVIDQITSRSTATDFKTYTQYRMTLNGDYTKVGIGGEVEDATLVESKYTNKVDQYGIAMSWTYEMFRNDDMNAFSKIAMQLGRRARMNQNEMLFDLLKSMIANNEHFKATGKNKNKINTKLSINGVAEAQTLFASLKDDAGKLMQLNPRYILIHPRLAPAAKIIQNSTNIHTTAAGVTGDYNPVSGTFETISTALFENETNPGQWLMLADPMECPIIDAMWLDGTSEPQIKTFDTDPRTFGMIIRASYSFGLAPGDARGAVYSDGTTAPSTDIVP